MTRSKKRLMPNERSRKTDSQMQRIKVDNFDNWDFKETSNNQNITLQTFQLTSRLQQRNEERTLPLVKMIRLDLRRIVSVDDEAWSLRPGSYVAFLLCRSNWDNRLNDMICFIIFCLNCIRRGRNATSEPGLSHFGSHHIGKSINILDGKKRTCKEIAILQCNNSAKTHQSKAILEDKSPFF